MVFAQDEPVEEYEVPPYQMMYDDPYDIRNLYIQFQPFFGDVGSLNITGGFGIEASYYHKSTWDANIAFRTSYGKKFDINRDAAIKNASNNNEFPFHYNLEFGGTYHLRDILMSEKSSTVLLYNKNLSGRDLATSIPKTTEVNGKVRNVIGIRLGGILHSTTVNINSVLVQQDKTLFYSEGTPIFDETLYSHLSTFTINVGGSYSWIRNYAIEFSDEWDPAGDDKMLTPYFDILFAPSVKLANLNMPAETVSTDPIDKLKVGFRGGLDVKFNKKFSWAYGVQGGLRPGIKGSGWYLMFKMSFPVYARKLDISAKPD